MAAFTYGLSLTLTQHDNLSENSFYMVGGIEDAVAKHEKSLKEMA